MKLFQIYEDDLETLERAIPALCEALSPDALNRKDIQEHADMCRSIVSKVRWNYGPHVVTKVIADEGDPGK